MSTEEQGVREPKPAERQRGVTWKSILVVVCLVLAMAIAAAIWAKSNAGRTTFPLKEVPVPDGWDVAGICHSMAKAKSANVKRYPRFVSTKPIFGQMFSKDNERTDDPNRGYYFAIDESGGTGKGYDMLYLDANRNLDLTDDKPAKSHAPKGKMYAGDVFFDAVTIPGGYGDGSDLAVAARIEGFSGPRIVFFTSGSVRQGRIKIAGRSYSIRLTRRERANGRYDQASVFVQLNSPESSIRIGRMELWYRRGDDVDGSLSTMFPVNNTWCNLTVSPSGDTVIVHPYRGELGLLKVSHTGKTGPSDFVASGTLRCASGMSAAIPSGAWGTVLHPAGSTVLLPVGDYTPEHLQICVDHFYATIRGRYLECDHAGHAESDYFLKIRREKPCDLDIESTAEILWQEDGSSRVAPGDEVDVSPVLTTRTLVIQDLSQRPNVAFAGTPLYPAVRIEDSAGKTLAEGTASDTFRWTIPADFVPRGGSKTLKITATWDTKELFGVITGTKEIVVESTDTRGGM